MAGYVTPGLPAPTVANGALPFKGTETFAVDTGRASGQPPQTVAVPLSALSSLGFGSVQPLVDGATITPDVSVASYFSVTLGGNRTFGAFANPTPGQEVVLELTQDATGSRTVTWNANVSWAAGTAPTLTLTAGATDIVRFTFNATVGKWRGETVGKAFA